MKARLRKSRSSIGSWIGRNSPLFFRVFVTAGSWRELNVLNSGLAHVTHLSATPLRQGCSSHFNPVTHFQDTGGGGAKRPVDVIEDWVTAVTLQSTTWSGEAPKSSAVPAAAAGEQLFKFDWITPLLPLTAHQTCTAPCFCPRTPTTEFF